MLFFCNKSSDYLIVRLVEEPGVADIYNDTAILKILSYCITVLINLG